MPVPTLRVMISEREDPRNKVGAITGFGWRRALPLSLNNNPPQWEDEEAEPPLLDFDLEPLLELEPEANHFLQKPAGRLEEDNRNRSYQNPQ